LLDSTLDHADEIVPPLGAREEGLERGQRLRIRWIEGKDLLVTLGRVVNVAEPLVDRGLAHPVVARERGVGDPGRHLVVQGDELGPGVRLRRHPLDRVARLGERGVILERRGERVERPREIVQVVSRDARDLLLQLDAPLDLLLGRRQDLEDTDELPPVGALLVDPLQDGGRLGLEVPAEHGLEGEPRPLVT
jgi:hypothetical protein